MHEQRVNDAGAYWLLKEKSQASGRQTRGMLGDGGNPMLQSTRCFPATHAWLAVNRPAVLW